MGGLTVGSLVLVLVGANPVCGVCWALIKSQTDSNYVGLRAVILLLMNCVLLPITLNWVTRFFRPARRSERSSMLMLLNVWLLLLNTLFIPAFGLLVFDDFVQWLITQDNASFRHNVQGIDDDIKHFMHHSGFFVDYLVISIFLTNGSSLIQLGSNCKCLFRSTVALTVFEKTDAMKLLDFNWGFRYAWMMAGAVVGLFLSVLFPCVIWLTALLLTTTFAVDDVNFRHKVFGLGPVDESDWAPRAVLLYQHLVAVWWLIMGIAVIVGSTTEAPWGSCIVPQVAVQVGGSCLCAASVLLAVWASASTQRMPDELRTKLPGLETSRCVAFWRSCLHAMRWAPGTDASKPLLGCRQSTVDSLRCVSVKANSDCLFEWNALHYVNDRVHRNAPSPPTHFKYPMPDASHMYNDP